MKIHGIFRPDLWMCTAWFLLGITTLSSILDTLFFGYPTYRYAKTLDPIHPSNQYVAHQYGWWGTSDLLVLVHIWMPIPVGLALGYMLGAAIRHIIRRNKWMFTVSMTDDNALFEPTYLISYFKVILLCGVFWAISFVIDQIILLGNGMSFFAMFGMAYLVVHSVWKSAYRRACVLVRHRNRTDAAGQG